MSTFDRKGYFQELDGGGTTSSMTPEELRRHELFLIEANQDRYDYVSDDNRQRREAARAEYGSWIDPILKGVQRLGAFSVLPFSVGNAMNDGQSFGEAVRGTSERFMEDPGSFTFREATDRLPIPNWLSSIGGLAADIFAPGPGEFVQGLNLASNLGSAASGLGATAAGGAAAAMAAPRLGGQNNFSDVIRDFTDEAVSSRQAVQTGQDPVVLRQQVEELANTVAASNPEMRSLQTATSRIIQLDDQGLSRFSASLRGINRNRRAVSTSLNNGGFTYDFDRGMVPMMAAHTDPKTGARNVDVYGYAVSPYPDLGIAVPVQTFPLSNPDALAEIATQFISERAPVLSRPHHAIGGWVNEGIFYFDISVLTLNRNEAIRIGQQANQKSVADFSAQYGQEFIPVGGSGVARSYDPSYLASYTTGGRFDPTSTHNPNPDLQQRLAAAENFYNTVIMPQGGRQLTGLTYANAPISRRPR